MMKIKLFAGLLTFGLFAFQSSSEEEVFKIGDKAPLTNLELTNINSRALTIESTTQKNGLLIVFSCNTCPFVVGNENFPGWEKQYNNLHKLAENNQIGMLLVNSSEGKRDTDESFDKMKDHAKSMGYTMPYVVDKEAQLANAFGAKTTPHVYLLDANYRLVYKGSIDNSWDSKRTENISYLENAFEDIRKGSDVTVKTTDPRGCSIKRTK